MFIYNYKQSTTYFSVNKEPVFRFPPAPLKIFKGQEWRYEVPVSDPEKQPLSYELVGDNIPEGMEISSDGVITWFPREMNKTFEFSVKATDPCDKTATGNFTVRTHKCSCEGMNGGVCEWMMTVANCKCPEGCTGPK